VFNVGLVLPPDVFALDMLKLGLPLLLCTLIDYESKSDCKSIIEETTKNITIPSNSGKLCDKVPSNMQLS
jgi:hypothetical protein